MPGHLKCLIVLVASLASIIPGLAVADGFRYDMEDIHLQVSIPAIPQMEMKPHPMVATVPHARGMGSDLPSATSISILMPTADAGMTPADCANSIFRSLVARYKLDPKAVVAARTNDTTFIALFPFNAGPILQLKAYIMSSHAGTHCVEVHVSKTMMMKPQAEMENELFGWLKSFRDSNISSY